MLILSAVYRKARWSSAALGLSLLACLTSCNLFEGPNTVAEFGPTPVDLQPKIVLQSLPTKGIEVAAWTRDDQHIITAVGPTRSIAIWEAETGNIVDRLRIPAEDGRTGVLLRLSKMEVTPDDKVAVISGLSARYVAEGEYADPRSMRYELDLTKRTVAIVESVPEPGVDLKEERIEEAADALEAVFENDDAVYQSPEDAMIELPALPGSHDGKWTLARMPVPGEGDGVPEGGLLLTSTLDGSTKGLLHAPMQKYDAATLSPTGRWIAMTNDKMESHEGTGPDQSIVEIYDIQTATFEPQVKIVGDYSRIQWLSDDRFIVTETSFRNGGADDGEGSHVEKDSTETDYGQDDDDADPGPPPDAVVVNARGGVIEQRFEAQCYMLAVSDGSFVGAGAQTCRDYPQGSFGLQKYDERRGEWRGFGPDNLVESQLIDLIAVSDDGRRVAVTEATSARLGEGALIGHIIDANTGELLASRTFEEFSFSDKMEFSPNGKDLYITGSGQVFRWQYETDEWSPMSIGSLDTTVLSRKHDIFAVAGEADDAVGLYNFAKGEALPSLRFGNVSSGGFFPDKPLFWAFSAEEGLRLWDTRDWSIVLTTYFFDKQGFLAVTPDGRYDSNVHPYDAKFRWLVPDQPFVSLNPDAFSRDYYTPGLTERWIACSVDETCDDAFAPIRPIAYLNRELPEVEIVDVEPGETPSEAIVTVEFSKPRSRRTGDPDAPWAFDPRVFRNHQLVFRQSGSQTSNEGGLLEWRSNNALESTERGKNGSVRMIGKIPLATGDQAVDEFPLFTAYVFNGDRIKSETAFFEYKRPEVAPRTPKAFVISIGIDHYQEARLNLNFAGNDATFMSESLSDIPGYEMRNIAIRSRGPTSGSELSGANDVAAPNQPEFISPAIITDILAILSRPQASVERRRLSALGIDTSMLERATPDDLVIISYAGHGWTDNTGEFYLVTSDATWSAEEESPQRDGLVSSVQLANWMSDIDAGTMALVIDACHSAASVENGTFKPGPLGDPGLGQLAFDKGVMILTATQADDVAVEDANLKHGLLTYVLAAEGLKAGEGNADLDRDGKIMLAEWLSYAVKRMPELQTDPRVEGLAARSVIFHDRSQGSVEKRIQEPSFFDFNVFPRSVALRQAAP